MSDIDGNDDDVIVVHIEPELDADLGGAGGAGDGVTKVVEPIADLKDQFATMKGQLDTTTQRAVNAESELQRTQREAREANDRAAALETEVIDARKSTVDQGLEAANTTLKTAKENYKRAFSDGDVDALADAQVQIAESTNTIARLKEAQGDLAVTKPAPRKEPEARRETPDAIEQVVSGLSAKSGAWVRAHPEFVTDPKKYKRMMAAHHTAMADDITADTPEYFEYLETSLGLKQAPQAKPGQQQQQRRPQAPTAPGSDVRGNGGGKVEVSLTRGEAKSATDGTVVWNYDDPKGKFKKGDPIGTQEMGRRKLIMTKEGRYDRSFVES